jgi:hypothetical protein
VRAIDARRRDFDVGRASAISAEELENGLQYSASNPPAVLSAARLRRRPLPRDTLLG